LGFWLSISLKPVETHRASAMHKPNLDTTAALIRYAICNKLVDAWHLSTGTFETDPVKAPEH
jgi:hypothetical protein